MPRQRRMVAAERVAIGWSPGGHHPVGLAILVAVLLVAVALIASAVAVR